MGLAAQQGIAVAHDTSARVVTGDGQGVAEQGGGGLREAGRNTTGNHIDAAHAQRLQAVRRAHGEGSDLGERCRIRAAAGAQVLLEYRQLATGVVEAAQGHRVIEVGDVQYQVGGTGIAVGIGQGVGEGFGTTAAAVQIEEVRI